MSKSDIMENLKLKFLEEYKELCLKHGFEIRGCGECGSAWLQKIDDESIKNNKLSWENKYEHIHFTSDYDMNNENRIKDNFQ